MGVFCNEPFQLNPEDILSRTSHELWEWYLKPELEKAEKIKRSQRRPGGELPEPFEPKNEDEALAALDALKAMLPGSVGKIPDDLYRGA